MNKNPVDIVVTFVNPSRSQGRDNYNYGKEKEVNEGIQNAKDPQAFGIERTRDGGIFNFWFRAVEQNCKGVRYVFLVVQSLDQLPEGLNTDNKKLKIVTHAEFIPADFLPTFSTMTIEIFTPLIKGLSSNYIMCNDDFYFMQPLTEEFFFKNDTPVGSYDFDSGYVPKETNTGGNIEYNSNKLVGKILGDHHGFKHHHLPYANNKEFNIKVLHANGNYLTHGSKESKFRYKTQCVAGVYPDLHKANKLTIDSDMYKNSIVKHVNDPNDFIEFEGKDMICINDTCDASYKFDQLKAKAASGFLKKFPNKSSFER